MKRSFLSENLTPFLLYPFCYSKIFVYPRTFLGSKHLSRVPNHYPNFLPFVVQRVYQTQRSRFLWTYVPVTMVYSWSTLNLLTKEILILPSIESHLCYEKMFHFPCRRGHGLSEPFVWRVPLKVVGRWENWLVKTYYVFDAFRYVDRVDIRLTSGSA